MSNQFKTITISKPDTSTLKRIQKLMSKLDAEFEKLTEETKAQTLDFHNSDTSLNHCIRWGLTAINELVEDLVKPVAPPIFGYYIDLDERSDFSADVRNIDGQTIFEIKSGDSLGEGETSIFEEGFMRDKTDISGLTDYLRDIGIIPKDGNIMSDSDFESEQEVRS